MITWLVGERKKRRVGLGEQVHETSRNGLLLTVDTCLLYRLITFIVEQHCKQVIGITVFTTLI